MVAHLLRIVFLITIVWQRVNGNGRKEGEVCQLDNGVTGICKHNCVENGEKKRSPVCAFRKGKLIVCCKPAKIFVPVKSNAKCIEYAEAVYEEVGVLTLIGGSDDHVKESTCAFTGQKLISGGEESLPKEFPHMVALGYEDDRDNIEWLCGGSLISDRYVLTVAHCLETQTGKLVKFVLLGAHNKDVPETEQITERVVERIRHPNYRFPHNDIGLLKLENDVTFSSYFRPACLHTNRMTHGDVVIATGWGILGGDGVNTSSKLMKAEISISEPSVCNTTLLAQRKPKFDNNAMICAGDPIGLNKTWKDTCQGDSGGPIQVHMTTLECMYSIVGLTSAGALKCGISKQPAIYTRVSHYVEWIENHVWPN